MSVPDHRTVTQLLGEAGDGQRDALDRLFPLVYDELRRLARRELHRERRGHTLDSVALVHEVYGRLVDGEVSWESRAHFFGICARSMRQILVNYARRRNAEKRGGHAVQVRTYDLGSVPGNARPDQMLELDSALTRLETISDEAMRLVEFRIFTGATLKEAAAALGMSYVTARRKWSFAKVWLEREFKHGA